MKNRKKKAGPARKKKKMRNRSKTKLPILFYTSRSNPLHPPYWK